MIAQRTKNIISNTFNTLAGNNGREAAAHAWIAVVLSASVVLPVVGTVYAAVAGVLSGYEAHHAHELASEHRRTHQGLTV